MRRRDFEAMVRAMTAELPPPFLEGVTGIEVTGKTVPHPLRADVYTLGECVPHVTGGPDDEGPTLRSRILLHYGSFAALAGLHDGFDWREEAWETLTHELRHHLEWRARVPALEALDDAVEANYARIEGDRFDPAFFLHGERIAERGEGREDVYKVEDDLFLDVPLDAKAHRAAPGSVRGFTWHGRRWAVTLPAAIGDVLFLTLEGVAPEPAGELVMVVRREKGMRDLLRRAEVVHGVAVVRGAGASGAE
jgi:hypothetical protein